MKCPLCKGEGVVNEADLSWLMRKINHALNEKGIINGSESVLRINQEGILETKSNKGEAPPLS